MRHLRIYENFPPPISHNLGEPSQIDNIHQFMKDNNIYRYYYIGYNKDENQYYLDVNADVNLSFDKLRKIPIKFGKVDGNFLCNNNNMDTLENSPNHVDELFDCSNNRLQNFIGGPKFVGAGYNCHNNNITDMRGFPENYKGGLYIAGNKISEILYFPSKVEGTAIDKYKYYRYIDLLNEYQVIRGTNVVQDRLEEILHYIGIKKEIQEEDLEFQNYRLI